MLKKTFKYFSTYQSIHCSNKLTQKISRQLKSFVHFSCPSSRIETYYETKEIKHFSLEINPSSPRHRDDPRWILPQSIVRAEVSWTRNSSCARSSSSSSPLPAAGPILSAKDEQKWIGRQKYRRKCMIDETHWKTVNGCYKQTGKNPQTPRGTYHWHSDTHTCTPPHKLTRTPQTQPGITPWESHRRVRSHTWVFKSSSVRR